MTLCEESEPGTLFVYLLILDPLLSGQERGGQFCNLDTALQVVSLAVCLFYC